MTPQMTSRRGCRVWFRRVAFALIIGIAVLIAAGFVFETVMESGDTSRYPRLGQLVNVDGQPVHIACVGEGSPAVIFIGGAGALSFQDASLQAQVQPYTHTCIYDRAGYLWSESRPEARTAWQLMTELHRLLSVAKVQPPYVLVGASNGGIYARAYAWQYPGEVAGLVMVDARLETELGKGGSLPAGIFQFMGRIGLFRLVPEIICPPDACDPAYREAIAVYRGYSSNLATYNREIQEGLDGSPEQIALLNDRLGTPGALGDLPLVILQANQSHLPLDQMEPEYRDFVEFYRIHYLQLSSSARYQLIDSGHGLAVEHPQAVLDAIMGVVTATRTTARSQG